MKLGYNTWSMPHVAFAQAVRELARIGYDSVEVTVSEGWATDAMTASDADARRWQLEAVAAGLDISSVTANAPLVCDEELWVLSRERLRRSLEIAAVLGAGRPLPVSLGAHKPKAPLLGAMPPPIIAQNSFDADKAQIVDRFAELAASAVAAGCTVALEPHAGAVVASAEQALEVLALVDSEALGINLDISHFAALGADLAAVIASLAPHASVVEVKDHRALPDGFEFLIPGEGDFDHAAFLRMLDGHGYAGTVSVEISVRRQAKLGFDAVAAAELSYATLAAAFDGAGINRERESRV